MTLGRALLGLSFAIGTTLHWLRWAPAVRGSRDLRVVSYHGIGARTSICQRYLRDEIPREVFRRQLDYLQANYDVVPLEEGIATVVAGRPTRPLVSITFDDGLRSLYTDAWPELERRGLPASIFLNTAVIDNTDLLWQHYVSALASSVGVSAVLAVLRLACAPERLIPTCQERFRDLPLSALAALGPSPATIAAEERPYLTWAEVQTMAATGLPRFYSHTARHYPLASVPVETMQQEIDDAVLQLRSRRGTRTNLVSFPFGMRRDYGHALPYALRRHTYALTIGDGWNPVRRVSRSRTVSRVALENETRPASLYAALEIQPLLKGMLNVAFARG
jgi:peptidoglycan/xylan/chitin deacetylase (PgdA/CDA1 family)